MEMKVSFFSPLTLNTRCKLPQEINILALFLIMAKSVVGAEELKANWAIQGEQT